MSIAIQLRHAVTVTAGATPASGTPEYWDGEIPWVTPEDVGRSREGYWLHDTRRKLTEDGYANCGATLVPDPSIVLTKRAPIGQLAVLSMEACCNQGCFLLSPRAEHDARFVYYLLSTQADVLQALGRGSTFMELATDDLKALKLTFPPLPRQRAIAAYLDRETAKIDAMIAAKERLLALLAEKRRALITHAVTRGLNPDAPMKDSGVEWLGEIPEHWDRCHLRRVLSSSTYGISASAGPEGEIPMLRMGDIVDGEIDYSKLAFVDSVDPEVQLQVGDLLFNRTNSLDQIGKVGLVRSSDHFPCTFASYLVRLRVNDRALPEFLHLLLNSTYSLSWARGEAIPSIGQANLNPFRYGYLQIPVPSTDEQRRIVGYCDTETTRIDSITRSTQATLSLLNERRSALIAAAVTGQIDVEDAA